MYDFKKIQNVVLSAPITTLSEDIVNIDFDYLGNSFRLFLSFNNIIRSVEFVIGHRILNSSGCPLCHKNENYQVCYKLKKDTNFILYNLLKHPDIRFQSLSLKTKIEQYKKDEQLWK